jgi:hypothetical protein
MQYARNRTYGSATVVTNVSGSSTVGIPARTTGLRVAIEIFNTGAQTIYRGPTSASVAGGDGLPITAGAGVILDSFLDNGEWHFRSSNGSTGAIRYIEYWR